MLSDADVSNAKNMEREQKRLTKRLSELDKLFSSLYEDKVMGKISERNFDMMASKYENEQNDVSAKLKDVTAVVQSIKGTSQGVEEFLNLVRRYSEIKELTPAIVNILIEKITIGERKPDKNGELTQEIKIFYKFVGSFDEVKILK